jgi:hypothetical protein
LLYHFDSIAYNDSGERWQTSSQLSVPTSFALIEEAAERLTNGNETEAVALAMRHLLEQDARVGSLFGVDRGSVRVREDVDIVAPALDVEPDAETGREIDR